MFPNFWPGVGGGGGEKHQSVASCAHPVWGSNPQPFGAHADAPTNRATQPGQDFILFYGCHVLESAPLSPKRCYMEHLICGPLVLKHFNRH